ncbi:hypothetical protein FQN57_004699 [Myotisia sp. PD_48]|nr:hypothetical protein FQN57_004699 [Myotisia sp. PD_48]
MHLVKLTALFAFFHVVVVAQLPPEFLLCPSSVSSAQEVLREYVRLLESHSCAKGCAVTGQTYDSHWRAPLFKPYWEAIFKSSPNPGDVAQKAEAVVQVYDSVVDIMRRGCTVIPKGNTDPGSQVDPGADLCEGPEVRMRCMSIAVADLASFVVKHGPGLLKAFGTSSLCSVLNATFANPKILNTFPEYLDKYAAVCPKRKTA